MLLLQPLGRKGVGAWEQSQFTAWAANSQHSPLGVGTIVTTPTPQPTRSPHPQAAKRIPSHLAPGSCTPKGRMESGGGVIPPPGPFALRLVRRQRLAIPLPHPRGPRLLAPSPLPLAVNCLKDKCSHPQGSSLHPKNLLLGLPTIG